MIKLTKYSPCRLHSYSRTIKKNRNIILPLILSMGIMESSISQRFFSPNTKITINQQKSDAFIKATPEISLKADYYNISKPVLETVLILQSNSGTSTSDGRYNYGGVKVHPELTAYPAFSKSKNGFVLCTTRSRGVEATALSLSLLRNDDKNSLSDNQWLSLVFGPNGDLSSLAHQADEIYTLRTGKSFFQLGIQFDNKMAVSDMVKSNKEQGNYANPNFESNENIPKRDEKEVLRHEVQVQQVAEKNPSDPTTPPVPVKKEEIVQSLVPELENEKIIEPRQEKGEPKPEVIISVKEEAAKPKEESNPFLDPEPKSISNNENVVKKTEKSTDAAELSPISSRTTREKVSVFKESQDKKITEPETKNTNFYNHTSYQSGNVTEHNLQKPHGPTDKGTQLLGGSASFVRTDGNSILTINPNMGFFVANNFAIGFNHFYAAKLDGDYSDINALGPFMKFYIGNSQKGKVFTQVIGGVAVADLDFDYITYSYGLRVGYAVFINNSIALEFSSGYDKIIDGDGRFGGNVGFQIHLNKNEKQN